MYQCSIFISWYTKTVLPLSQTSFTPLCRYQYAKTNPTHKINICQPLVFSPFLHPRWPIINIKWLFTAHSAAPLCNVYVLSEHIKVILEIFQVSCITVHESCACERTLGREWVTHPDAPSFQHWLGNNSPLSHCIMIHFSPEMHSVL